MAAARLPEVSIVASISYPLPLPLPLGSLVTSYDLADLMRQTSTRMLRRHQIPWAHCGSVFSVLEGLASPMVMQRELVAVDWERDLGEGRW